MDRQSRRRVRCPLPNFIFNLRHKTLTFQGPTDCRCSASWILKFMLRQQRPPTFNNKNLGSLETKTREYSLTLRGNVSLWGWPPVWIQQLCYVKIINRFALLVESKSPKLEGNFRVMKRKWVLSAKTQF